MGARANLVIVKSSRWDLYYSHWGAGRLWSDLFWGSAHAEQFIRIQRPVENNQWLDSTWAEGGVVLDFDRRRLLFFETGDFLHSIPTRRVFLRLMQSMWEGWTIEWAHEGIVSIAEAVGVPRAKVIDANGDLSHIPRSLEILEDRSWVRTIGCIVRDGETRLYPLGQTDEIYVDYGPRLLGCPGADGGLTTWSVRDRTDEFPTGGFWIDVSARRLEFWSAHDFENRLVEILEVWPGWTVVWHEDRYETQFARFLEVLHVEARPEADIVDELRNHLRRNPTRVDLTELVQRLSASEGPVTVNPNALRDDRLAAFEQAVSRLTEDATRPAE